jgi:hypothetical protein
MIGVIMSPMLSCDMSAGKPMEPPLEVAGASMTFVHMPCVLRPSRRQRTYASILMLADH